MNISDAKIDEIIAFVQESAYVDGFVSDPYVGYSASTKQIREGIREILDATEV